MFSEIPNVVKHLKTVYTHAQSLLRLVEVISFSCVLPRRCVTETTRGCYDLFYKKNMCEWDNKGQL